MDKKEPSDNDRELDLDKENALDVESNLSSDLDKWLEEARAEEIQPVIKLYKFLSPFSKEKSWVQNFDDRIPSEPEIKDKFGAGKYYIFIQIPKGKKQKERLTSRTISIMDTSTTVVRVPEYQQPQNNSANEAFKMLERMMSMFLPLLMSQQQKPSGNPAENMMGMYAAMNGIMKNSLIENQKLFNDVQRGMLNITPQPEEQEIVETEKPSLIEKYLPLIAQMLPSLLAPSPQANMAASAIRMVPEVQKILKNPDNLQSAVNTLYRKFPKSDVDKALSVLQGKKKPAPKQAVDISSPKK